jgi:hypothetical protein
MRPSLALQVGLMWTRISEQNCPKEQTEYSGRVTWCRDLMWMSGTHTMQDVSDRAVDDIPTKMGQLIESLISKAGELGWYND